jgi:hypothetical protein
MSETVQGKKQPGYFMNKNLNFLFSKKVLAIVLLTIILLCLLSIFIFNITQPKIDNPIATAQILVISALTDTPTIEPTSAAQVETQDVLDGISIGALVAIDGTGGAGLRIRIGAGTSEAVSFVAGDGDRFEIVDGPVERDGYIWWLLSAENAPEKSGWAVADYLVSILP